MANLITSIGYSLGKLHTGMIAHLCELHREGRAGPLCEFLKCMGVEAPRNPAAKREWRTVDLAVFDAIDPGRVSDPDRPEVLIEMKVDDYDHETTKWVAGTKRRDFQTVVYAEMHPRCSAYLYVTLGTGEYFHAPYGQKFQWIRIRNFLDALDAIRDKDQPIKDWTEAVRNEVSLQDAVHSGDRSRMGQYRTGAWNIYFLGLLKEQFEQRAGIRPGFGDSTCYTYGSAPDTILHFGPIRRFPAYMEINNNGRLNLKLPLEEYTTPDDKQRAIGALLEHVNAVHPKPHKIGDLCIHQGRRMGASKTVASFDVGLRPSATDGGLEFAQSMDETLGRLERFIGPLYRD